MQKKSLVPVLCALLILGGIATYLLAFRQTGVPGELYRYYPDTTGFYLELAPGENLTRRFVAFLDETVSRQEELAQQRVSAARQAEDKTVFRVPTGTVKAEPHAKSQGARAESKPPTASPPNALTAPEANHEQRLTFRRVFLQKFNSTFKPFFSLGVWPDPQARPDEDKANTLVVFPLKDENVTLGELVRRFDDSSEDVIADEFIQEKFNLNETELSFIIEKTSKTSLAVLDRRLLITNSPQAMRTILGHYVQKMPNVYDNPLNERYLTKLPPSREGTFILNNTVYGPNTISRPIGAQFKPVSRVMPLTVGSVHVKDDHFITTRFVTPVLLDQIPDPAVRGSLRAVYQASAKFDPGNQLPKDTTFFVGIAGLDKFYDLYTEHMLPPRNLQMLKGIDYFLTGFKLDLRRDIISLFENGTVIATRPVRQSLIVLLQKDDKKQEALDRISSVLATNKLPVRQTTRQMDNMPVNTMTIPNRQQSKVTYAPLSSSIAFAPPFDFEALLNVTNGEADSLQQSERYKALMSDLPREGSLVLYADFLQQAQLLEQQFKTHGRTLNHKLWLEGVSLALWSGTRNQDGVDLIEGRLNMKLTPFNPISRKPKSAD